MTVGSFWGGFLKFNSFFAVFVDTVEESSWSSLRLFLSISSWPMKIFWSGESLTYIMFSSSESDFDNSSSCSFFFRSSQSCGLSFWSEFLKTPSLLKTFPDDLGTDALLVDGIILWAASSGGEFMLEEMVDLNRFVEGSGKDIWWALEANWFAALTTSLTANWRRRLGARRTGFAFVSWYQKQNRVRLKGLTSRDHAWIYWDKSQRSWDKRNSIQEENLSCKKKPIDLFYYWE